MMSLADFLTATVLGIVEGLTEFLPVSSTGHLIIASELLGYTGNEANTFNVFIQLGAILAVLVYFRERFAGLLQPRATTGFSGIRGIGFLLLTTLPALFFGKLFHGAIKAHLFSTNTVAIGLAVGAVWILLTEYFHKHGEPKDLDQITWQIALGIGLFQCLAMWPGMSRSACTIMGALYLGLNRRAATEYSFFAAVPVMVAAVGYDLYSSRESISTDAWLFFTVGFVTAFISALAAVKFFINFISRHTFKPFAWYRLALAAVLFAWLS
jgi:undecaprenyl-diphosphatase